MREAAEYTLLSGVRAWATLTSQILIGGLTLGVNVLEDRLVADLSDYGVEGDSAFLEVGV
jgi:hypothetical protein